VTPSAAAKIQSAYETRHDIEGLRLIRRTSPISATESGAVRSSAMLLPESLTRQGLQGFSHILVDQNCCQLRACIALAKVWAAMESAQ